MWDHFLVGIVCRPGRLTNIALSALQFICGKNPEPVEKNPM